MGLPKLKIAGERYGSLTVLHEVKSYRKGSTRWACRCDCGAFVNVQSCNLRSGSTRSCGCLRRMTRRQQRGTVPVTINGRTQLLIDWSRELGIPYSTLRNRLKAGTWPVRSALEFAA